MVPPAPAVNGKFATGIEAPFASVSVPTRKQEIVPSVAGAGCASGLPFAVGAGGVHVKPDVASPVVFGTPGEATPPSVLKKYVSNESRPTSPPLLFVITHCAVNDAAGAYVQLAWMPGVSASQSMENVNGVAPCAPAPRPMSAAGNATDAARMTPMVSAVTMTFGWRTLPPPALRHPARPVASLGGRPRPLA
jgi:hypothetical protein